MSRHENKEFTVRNFVCVIHKMRPDEALVETEVLSHTRGIETVAVTSRPAVMQRSLLRSVLLIPIFFFPPQLFPRGALEMYTAKNMGWDVTAEQVQYFFHCCKNVLQTVSLLSYAMFCKPFPRCLS